MPFDAITRQLAEQLAVAQAVTDRTLNTVAVAVACALLDYDPTPLARALAKVFPDRTKVIAMNRHAVELTYDFVRQHLPAHDFRFRLQPVDTHERRLFVNGNQMVALGKLAAGMTFQTYYPISPAMDETDGGEACTEAGSRCTGDSDRGKTSGLWCRYASLTLVSWGSNKGAILEALQRLALDGIAARLVQVHILWPFPTDEILPWLETATTLVVVELNYSGQLAQLLREQTGQASDYLVVKFNGRPMTGQELYRTFTNIHVGGSAPRMVLRNPYE